MKKDFDLDKQGEYINIEIRTDGGVVIYFASPDGASITLDKRELTLMAKWLVEWLSEHETK